MSLAAASLRTWQGSADRPGAAEEDLSDVGTLTQVKLDRDAEPAPGAEPDAEGGEGLVRRIQTRLHGKISSCRPARRH